jgi:hypothetical protein
MATQSLVYKANHLEKSTYFLVRESDNHGQTYVYNNIDMKLLRA